MSTDKRELYFIDRHKEMVLYQKLVDQLKKNTKFDINPEDTLLLNVSPDYSSIISMLLLHEFSRDGEILDMFNVEVPYPDQLPSPFELKFEETFKSYSQPYKNFMLIEAGVISGRNYTWLVDTMCNMFNINKNNILTVALCQNKHSIFQCDVVGEYYDNNTQDLTFSFEKYNKHF
jgi:hypothetical protein